MNSCRLRFCCRREEGGRTAVRDSNASRAGIRYAPQRPGDFGAEPLRPGQYRTRHQIQRAVQREL